MNAHNFFGVAAKIPIIGDFIIGSAIYFVLSVVSATTNGFGLPSSYHPSMQYAFLYISIIYFVSALGYRLWNFLRKSSD